jgi:hypothetical protein
MVVKKYVKRKTKRMYGGSFVPKTKKTLKHRALAFGAKTAAYLTPKWMAKPFMSQAFKVASQAKKDIKNTTGVKISKRQMAIIAAKVYGSSDPEQKALKLIKKKVIKSAKKEGKVLTQKEVKTKVDDILKIAVKSVVPVEQQTTIPGIRIEAGVKSGVEAGLKSGVETVKAVQELVKSNPLLSSALIKALMNSQEKQALGKDLGSVPGGVPGAVVGSRVGLGEEVSTSAVQKVPGAESLIKNLLQRVPVSLIPNPAQIQPAQPAPVQPAEPAPAQAQPPQNLQIKGL